MAAPVRIESRAWGDVRFATLARVLGLADADHALIKVARLWSWQTDHYDPERPTYELDRDTIESVLGSGGPEALVRAKLATETESGWRMHGTEGQIEWSWGLASKRSRAGRARADSARRGGDGRLLCNDDDIHPACAGGAGPASTSTRPAQSSAPSPSPSPSQDQKEESRPQPAVVPDRAVAIAELAVSEINRLSGRSYSPAAKTTVTDAKRLAKDKRTDDEILLVIRSKVAWAKDPQCRDWFCPGTLLRQGNFPRYLDEARAKQPRAPVLALVPVDDEPDLSYQASPARP